MLFYKIFYLVLGTVTVLAQHYKLIAFIADSFAYLGLTLSFIGPIRILEVGADLFRSGLI